MSTFFPPGAGRGKGLTGQVGVGTPPRLLHSTLANQTGDGETGAPVRLTRTFPWPSGEGGTRAPLGVSCTFTTHSVEEETRSAVGLSPMRVSSGVGTEGPRQASRTSGAPVSSFPPIDARSDRNVVGGGKYTKAARGTDSTLGSLIEKVPQSIWQANAVVPRHRRKAHLYWTLLLIGYALYIILVSLERTFPMVSSMWGVRAPCRKFCQNT